MPKESPRPRIPMNLARFVRFCIVGGSGVLVNYAVYLPLSRLTPIGPYFSEAAAFEISLLSNFLLNEAWTFRDRSLDDAAGFGRRLGRFHLVSLGGLALNLLVFGMFLELVGLPDLMALLFGIAAATMWNFLVNLRWTWSDDADAAADRLWRWPGRLGRYGRRLLPVVFVGLWLFCVAQYALRPARLPAEEDYRALAEAVEQGFGEGDVLAFAPFWAERGRLWLGDHPILGVRDPADEDLSRYSRLWLVGVFERDAAPIRDALAARYRLDLSERHGTLTLDRFVLPSGVDVHYDFVAEVDRAEVTIEGKAAARCDRWQRQRWICPGGQDWHFVGRLQTDVDYNPRTCLWAHPTNQGALVVEYPDVPLGAVLRGRHGIRRTGAGKNPSPVVLAVSIDGEPAGRFEAEDRLGYFPFEVSTASRAGRRATVRFSISSRNVGTRHYCFEALTASRKAMR